MQVLTAYVTDAGWRPEAFGTSEQDLRQPRWRARCDATDLGVLGRDLAGLMHGGDRRWTFPTALEMAATKLEDLQGPDRPSSWPPVRSRW